MSEIARDEKKKRKAVGWRLPEGLRRRLNSHADYLSSERESEDELDTEVMVAEWLEERLRVEERKRALRTLGMKETDLTGHLAK